MRTLGGAVSVDASGSHWLRSRSSRQHIISAEVVLADGSVVELGVHPVEPRTDGGESTRLSELVHPLAVLLDHHAERIVRHRPRSVVNASGYDLHDVLRDGSLNLARLLVGSEGTLAFITQATLGTEPIAPTRSCVLFIFDRLEKAAHAVAEVLPLSPTACDLMDRRHLNLARESDVRFELMIPGAAEAVLLVEFEGEEMGAAVRDVQEAVDRVSRRASLAAGSQVAEDPDDVALCWKLARGFAPTLYRMMGLSRPVPFVEDIAVPPENVAEMLSMVQNILKRHEVTASLFAHAGHGQIHIRPLIDISNADDRRRLVALADELYSHVWGLSGTISGEQGDGLSRTPYLAKQYGPLSDVFRDVKNIFDPDNILNPGKIVPTSSVQPAELLDGTVYPALPGSGPIARIIPAAETSVEPFEPVPKRRVGSVPLGRERHSETSVEPLGPIPKRRAASSPADRERGSARPRESTLELQLDWQPDGIEPAIDICNRCGVCRIESGVQRMCPVFRFAPREEASPRAKVNLLRSVLTGRFVKENISSEAFKQVADLCVHCHMCRLECPAQVDVPQLMIEAKAAHIRNSGMKLNEWLLAHIDGVCAAGSRLRSLSNWAMTNRLMRWIIEKTLDISQGRKFPPYARRTFFQQAHRRKLTRPTRGGTGGERVAYFVDTYANYFDVMLAEALVAVLEHNGVPVFVPPRQKHSAMALIAHGAIEAAQTVARQNIMVLAEAVRQGYTIVATEPSAALALAHEYPALMPNDEDTRLVAHATREACHYLWKLHQRGDLVLDFEPIALSVGYHVPCHVKALDVGTPAQNLLSLVPGLRIETLERGCSGMAGTFGLAKRNYRNSLRAGLPLINGLRDAPIDAGMTECCMCKMQMEHGMVTPTTHPIKLLAFAYGLMPELGDELASDQASHGL